MAKKTKGKQRKDKFYILAKDIGYRSRSAFKLIQLNRKYEFLQRSRVLIDLCAAPGGWLQVAHENMPVSSVIVGVDLYPIKPLQGVLTLQEDITTDKCRQSLKRELKTWKVDCVLHDGSPNVGKNWLHDATQQAQLTLMAVKLATEFLHKGGWFVTKIFRSKDYHALLWVFKQLFKKVFSTKPQASRHESAEIYVVCQNYFAPDKIDPRFLNAKYVFQELTAKPSTKLDLHPLKKKKKSVEGYEEGATSLFRKIPVSEFIKAPNSIEILNSCTELFFDDEWIISHPKTTAEIQECCKDVKVLGRTSLRLLLNWKKNVKGDLEKKQEEKVETVAPEQEEDGQTDEDKELAELDQKILELQEKETLGLKRKKKTIQKQKKKLIDRMNMKMIIPGDVGPEVLDPSLFNLKTMKSQQELKKVVDQDPNILVESEKEEDDNEDLLPRKRNVVYYKKEHGHLDNTGKFYHESDSEQEECSDSGDSDKESLGLDEKEENIKQETAAVEEEEQNEEVETEDNPLLDDLQGGDTSERRKRKANLWFDKDVFQDLEVEEDEDFEIGTMIEQYRSKGGHIVGEQEKGKISDRGLNAHESGYTSDSEDESTHETVNQKFQKSVQMRPVSETDKKPKHPKIAVGVNNECDAESIESDLDEEEDMKNVGEKEFIKKTDTSEKTKQIKKKLKLDAEGLALGSMMIQSKKVKRDIIDAAWNRYAFSDEGLPDWFVEDEKKHLKKPITLTKELVAEYKDKLKEISARPIKKVVEAKARKKRRTQKRMEKAKKKVEGILESMDMTDMEKAREIKRIYKIATGKKKPEITYVVAKKHLTAKKVRPRGVKGIYKMVDPRMKKDIRKKQMSEKKGRKKTRQPKKQKSKIK